MTNRFYLRKDTLEFDLCTVKRDHTDFTEQEVEELLDSFLAWVEKEDMWMGGSIGWYKEEVEDAN